VFYRLPEGASAYGEGNPYIKEIDFNLRSQDHLTAIQFGLDKFSSSVGFGENFYKYASAGGPATATQVITENTTLYRTIKKHQIILDAVLIDLIRLIIAIAEYYDVESNLDIESEIIVNFDDSILEDKEKDRRRMLDEIAAGILRPEIYVMKTYGVTKEIAMQMMPGGELIQTESKESLPDDIQM
jgi:A118 family predicted phage portal protein